MGAQNLITQVHSRKNKCNHRKPNLIHMFYSYNNPKETHSFVYTTSERSFRVKVKIDRFHFGSTTTMTEENFNAQIFTY